MKDIKSLYYAARTSGNRTDIASYNEAVQQLFESGPLSVLPNVEYIISSDANLKKMDDMFAEYGLAIPVCNQIIEILESNVERCNTLGVDGSLFSEALNSYKQFRDNHKTCFDMYEYYLNDTQLSDYVKSYYSVNSGGIQGRRLAAGMISKFGEAAIPDAIITSDKYGRNTVSTLYEFLYPKTDALAKEWISECSREIDNIDPKTYQLIEENSLSALINKKDMTDNAFIRESVINGNEDACIPYSESDIKNIQDLIAFKEFKVACTEDTEYINTLQNEIYSIYESLEDIVDSDGESVFEFSENKLSKSVKIAESRLDNADTKYTGNVPSYLARNHNLNWGETDVSKPVSDPDDESKSIEDYKRPSAIDKDNNQENNEINKSDEEIEDKDKKDKSSIGVNNYYYYTYTNSLNKNSNSFNKDNSNHSDDHSVHSSSDDHSSHRYNDDHSTGKRINSNDYGTKESDNHSDDDMEEAVYTFIESSNYYMDNDTYDSHIKQIWFIKSDDKADNCCVSVEGYSKPMRGRSTMIALKKENDKWQALIKKKPNGQWEFPGGGWDKGEKPVDAAERECHEEAQVKVKNIRRLGTQIQYNDSKVAVSPWVKKHVANKDDWWYGYYSAIFVGEEDGKFTGHISEEDFEDTFQWKTLDFIAKKFPRKLMDAIESYIKEEFKESVSDDEDEYMEEAVNVTGKKFTKAYKAAFNYENGHLIKITYSLQGCEITNVGLSKAMIDHVQSVASETNKENHRGNRKTKNIRAAMVVLKGIANAHKQVKNRKKLLTDFLNEHIGDLGYLDFQAKNCKIIGLYDLYTRKEITDEIPIVGVYAARHMESGKAKILTDKDLAAVHKLLESGKTKFHVANHKVGDTEIYPTFMSTYWNEKEDHSICDLNQKVIDSDQRDRSEEMDLDNIPALIGDLEAKGFHVSDAEAIAFLKKYRGTEKWIPDALPQEVKSEKRKQKPAAVTEAVGDADDMRPESDHPIRDLAQDVDRNLAKTQQAAKKKVQGVVQAGSAFMKPVKRTHQWVMKMCNDWKDAKETKIKEKFADPHARKGIFSAITWCIKTGSLAKAGLLFNPVFVFLSITKNIGKKDKMKRIRAEMIGEIKQEIKIIQEKRKDADAAGDKAAKYKLMRLENELQKKLLRVGGSDVRSWKKIL